MRILALFDDGSQSVKKSLSECDVVSVGLNDCADVQLNLAKDENLLVLRKMHTNKPFDLVFASPPCESWSIATACTGGNVYRFRHTLKLRNFEQWRTCNYNNVRKLVERRADDLLERFMIYEQRGINGNLTALFTKSIICQLGIPFVIENPKSSMIWQYFKQAGLDFIPNVANYSAYDKARSLKPTIFASNVELKLKTAKKAKTNMRNLKGRGDGSKRADIPSDLVRVIVEQMKTYA